MIAIASCRHHPLRLAILFLIFVFIAPCQAFSPSSPIHAVGGVTREREVSCLLARKRKAGNQQHPPGGGGGFGSSTSRVNSSKQPKDDGRSASVPATAPLLPPEDRLLVAAERKRKARRQAWGDGDDDDKEEVQPVATEAPQAGQRMIHQRSTHPLIFTIDDFIEPDLCRRVNNNAEGCFHLLFPERVADQLFRGQESEQDGLLFNANSSADHDKISSSGHNINNQDFPDGLHMDTNNDCALRHVTCILYLNDVPEVCGGATVFPLAATKDDERTIAGSRRLLAHGVSHTRSASVVASKQLGEAVQRMEGLHTDVDTTSFLRVQPKAGRLLVFFSRDDNGAEDPYAWHAGERLKAGPDGAVTEKRILTLFKEVPLDGPTTTPTAAQMAPMVAEQRHWLQALAKLQQAIQQ